MATEIKRESSDFLQTKEIAGTNFRIPNWKNKTSWTGDNLHIMRGMNSESVDLIYLDPPFNSDKNYAAPIGSEAAGAEFKDTWTLNEIDIEWLDLIKAKYPALNRVIHAAMTDSDKSYMIYMAPRLIEMHRILKSMGSIYLHCDPTMSHYLKLMMDAIFGRKIFQSEITWKRTFAHGDRVFANVSDIILFYGERCQLKDDILVPLGTEYIEKHFKSSDSRGKYQVITLTGAGTSSGESGEPWKGVDPTLSNRHWSPPKTGRIAKWIDQKHIPNYQQIQGVHARLESLDDAGFIYWPQKQDGIPRLKRYLMENDGRFPTNIWADIPPLNKTSKEQLHYPTQKPLALLKRIILASSNPNDIVFDPFCGCATTCVAAEIMNYPRQWVGIDISPKASELVVKRIKKVQGQLFREIIRRNDIPLRTDLGKIPKYNSAENKKKLYGEQGGNCNGCGILFPKQNLDVDHIIARSKGGTDHIENLQLLCGNCNSVKGNRGMEYLMAELQK